MAGKSHYDRRPRTGIMLAYPFKKKRLLKWGMPLIVQPKYNGERCLAVNSSGWSELYSSTALPITTMPHIAEAVKQLPPGIYDGEIYLHGNFQKLSSLISTGRGGGALHPDHEKAHLVIFDMKNPYPQNVRLAILKELQDRVDPTIIKISPFWLCTTMQEVEKILGEQMALGYEGVILRELTAAYVEKRATTMMKLKPRSSDTYRIVGFHEETSIYGEPKGRLGAFQVVDADGNQFKVGSGLTHKQREEYWKADHLLGSLIYVKYQALTDRGVPWFPVFVEVVKAERYE
jgi:ATP-dependent DNA ligase